MIHVSKILVTGSEGFAGVHLCNYLVERGYKVIGIDNLSKYGRKRNNLDPAYYEFVNLDVRDEDKLAYYLKQVNACVGFAARVGGIKYVEKNPYTVFHENMEISIALTNALSKLKNHSLQIIGISTSMVYEQTNNFPSSEDSVSLNPPPTSYYAFQKLAQERHLKAYSLGSPNNSITLIRPFNLVGAGEEITTQDLDLAKQEREIALTHVIPDLIRKIFASPEEIEILGNGEQVRNYVHAYDLSQAIELCISNKSLSAGQTYNIGSRDTLSVNDLILLISKCMGLQKMPRVIKTKQLSLDVMKNIPNINKAVKELGYNPRHEIEDTIKSLILLQTNK